MKGKIALLVGGAVGYVLGAQAGRERYEQIKGQAQSLWGNPKVQEKAGQAQQLVKEKAADAATAAKDAAKDKVSGDSTGTGEQPSAAYPTSASTPPAG